MQLSMDKDGFENIFNESKKYFGNFTEKSMQVTNSLIKEMKKNE